MKKLKLDLDSLRVDAFDTLPAGGRGTVAGRDAAAITVDCTNVEHYSCWEDCTTRGEDLSCQPTCPTTTSFAPGCAAE